MTKKLIFAILFVILIVTPIAANQYYSYLLKPASKSEETQIFVIKPGQPITQIGENLKKAGLIKSPVAFRLYVQQSGIAKAIQYGDFRLSPNLSTKEIADHLTHGAIDVWITFPEGTRKEEMAQVIENALKRDNESYNFDKNQFLKEAQEGHLFPDTYLIAKDASTEDIVNRLTMTFNEKVGKATLLKGTKAGLTEEEVIILASLIEKEAITNEERPIIAGILVNRINDGMALQVDAAVRYGKGYDTSNNSWWSPPVTQDDLKNVKSPYNTYLHTGLPPTAISNPGIESIRAAAEPADTPYFYYLHDSEGKIHYATTGEEHEANIQKYL